MSATTTTPNAPSRALRARAVEPLSHTETARLTLTGTIRAEWLKLLSLRSTWWTLLITIAVMVLIALAQASSLDLMLEGADGSLKPHGAEVITGGYQFGMITIAVLGSLLMTGEYSSGMIRSTLAAVPTRLPVLVGKALALMVVTIAVSVMSILGSFLVATPMLADHDLVPGLDDPETWQVFGGMTLLFLAVALLSLGLAAVLRHTAGAITAALGLLLVLPGVLQFITIDWVQDVISYMPLPAAMAFLDVSGVFGTNELLSAWQGVAVLGGYVVVALLAGVLCLRNRDA